MAKQTGDNHCHGEISAIGNFEAGGTAANLLTFVDAAFMLPLRSREGSAGVVLVQGQVIST